MFHAKNGLYFERLENGSVRILKRKDAMPDSPVIMDETLDNGTFASVICSCSVDREMYGQWSAAMQLLGVPGFENGWENYQKSKPPTNLAANGIISRPATAETENHPAYSGSAG